MVWRVNTVDGWMNFQNSLTCFDFLSIITAVQLKNTFPLSLFVILHHYNSGKPMKIKKLMKVSFFCYRILCTQPQPFIKRTVKAGTL